MRKLASKRAGTLWLLGSINRIAWHGTTIILTEPAWTWSRGLAAVCRNSQSFAHHATRNRDLKPSMVVTGDAARWTVSSRARLTSRLHPGNILTAQRGGGVVCVCVCVAQRPFLVRKTSDVFLFLFLLLASCGPICDCAWGRDWSNKVFGLKHEISRGWLADRRGAMEVCDELGTSARRPGVAL